MITDQWAPGTNTDVGHISLTTEVAALVVAPATANLIAKLAHGLADDFLTTFALATRCPILLAPAMNTQMLAHPAVEANLATLRGRGVRLIEPGSGYLACGWVGPGRLAEPEDIVTATCDALAPAPAVADLAGRRVLITAGPTYEDIDPVRYVGNRSSGRMGVALAEAARRRGAAVTLVLGPSAVAVPAGARGGARAQRGRDARGGDAGAAGTGRRRHGGRGRRLHAGGAGGAEDHQVGRAVDADARPGRATSSPTSARRATAPRVRSWSASPPRPPTRSRAAGASSTPSASTWSSPTT